MPERDATGPPARWTRELRILLAPLRLSPAREAEIVEELSQHLDDRLHELTSGGTPPDEAARLTLAELRDGSRLAAYMSPLRQARHRTPPPPAAPTPRAITGIWQDLRYALRAVLGKPGFAAGAILTLALGIGATTAIFSVVYGVLLKPLPFHDSTRLVSLVHRAPGINVPTVAHGPATYFTYRESQRAFEGIGAWESTEVSITGGGDPEQVEALAVGDATLPQLRVQPLLGRLFTAEDDAPGAPLRAVLTHGYWQRRFGGAQTAVGRVLQIDGAAAEIIGVLPPSFRFLRTEPALLLPMQLARAEAMGVEFDFQALARLKPGVTIAEANADVARMIPLLPAGFADLRMEPNVRPLADEVIGDVGQVLWILLAAVGMVLLIACGNVANLFLIRAEGRQQELAIRAALGASRARLARVLLAESLLLSLAGGALGVALAHAVIVLLRYLAPAELPRVDDIALDPPVLLFTLGVSLLSGVLFGLAAILRFSAPGAAALKEGGRGGSDAPARHRTRNSLAVAQIALALMLMVVSGLMIRTFVAMRAVHPGFSSPTTVQTFRLAIPPGQEADPQQFARTHQAIAERLAAVPGVASVGLSSSITMDGEDNGNPLYVEGVPVPERTLPPLRRFKSVAPGYFETMGNPLVAGRTITWTDVHEARPVIVVSEVLAREYWDDPSRALGKRVRASPANPWREIVGVVGNERDDGVNHPPTALVYWPLVNETYLRRNIAYAVRSGRVGQPGFLRELQQAVHAVSPQLPLGDVQTLDAIQARSMAQTTFAMTMLGIAAGVALCLGVVGIYGVVAYLAAQRTREIGIRMALGAQVQDVRAMFLRHGLRLTAAGIGVGLVVALALTRVLSALLFGVRATDLVTYAAVSAVLAAVALVAIWIPARRASRVDPVLALRAEV